MSMSGEREKNYFFVLGLLICTLQSVEEQDCKVHWTSNNMQTVFLN